MANDLSALQVRLDLQSAQFEKGMSQATRSMGRMNNSSKNLNRQMSNMQRSMGGALRSMLAIAGVSFGVSFLKGVIETNSALAKQADAVGLSVERFQEFQFGAKKAGIEAGQFASNMTAFVKRVGEAQAGTGQLVAGLEKIDSSLASSIRNSKGQEDAFRLIADAIEKAGSASEKAQLANLAFSRSGVSMVNMLREGSAGLDAMTVEAHKLGVVMDEELVRNSEAYDNKLVDLTERMRATFGNSFLKLIGNTMDNSNKIMFAFFGAVEKGWNGFVKQARHSLITLSASLKNLNPFASSAKIFAEARAEQEKLASQLKIDNDLVDKHVLALFRWEDALIKTRNETAKARREMNKTFVGTGGQNIVEDFSVKSVEALTAMEVATANLAVQGIGQLVDVFFDANASFKEFSRNFLTQIAKMIVQVQLLNALGGTSFGSALGIPARASGGAVVGGSPYIVGERGAELFVPSASGAIVPNSDLGGGAVTVNVINNTSAQATTTESHDAQGGKTIDVIIEEKINASFKQGGMDNSMSSNFGISRRGF